MKYLDFYYECLETGYLPGSGLCHTDVASTDLFQLIKPTDEDIDKLYGEGKPVVWWGMGDFEHSTYEFSPLRQNLILLMAALNGEL